MATCLIGLGSNLGDRLDTLRRAVSMLDEQADVQLQELSGWHHCAAVGGPSGQDEFLNAAATIHTSLAPPELLTAMQGIETALGRRRERRWAPRTADLDLLLYDNMVLDTPRLVLPHPRMALRRFVLEPAAEVASQMVHPVIGWSVERLLDHLNTAAQYVAVCGLPRTGKTSLAEHVAAAAQGRVIRDPPHQPWPEASRDDSLTTDRTWRREMELLDARAALLDVAAWPAGGSPAISDFWFDQSLARAMVLLDASQREMYLSHWQQARRRVVQPKLLVWLDPPDANRVDETLRQSLLQRFAAPDGGPRLRLADPDIHAAREEALAAVLAMR